MTNKINLQATAENVVRRLRPHLRELSFGCVIKTKLDGELTICCGATDSHLSGKFIAHNGDHAIAVAEIEITEIIGHQPQLQDWLGVLCEASGVYETKIVYVKTDYLYVYAGTTTKITIDLTTGQPATPVDYQIFLDIVGYEDSDEVLTVHTQR